MASSPVVFEAEIRVKINVCDKIMIENQKRENIEIKRNIYTNLHPGDVLE